MGALEYAPAVREGLSRSAKLRVDALVRLASEVLGARRALAGSLDVARRHTALTEILRVGTSAGGARAKAVIAWNPATDEVRSGQVAAPPGFTYWLLKFDGVTGNRDKELEDPRGYTVVEYAYARMAAAAGITMTECRLLEEGGRRHFMTRRYDRQDDGGKWHVQSLGALAHLDYNAAGAHSYEQCFAAIERLGLPMRDREQQFRRMVFNVVARNQDDHVKNIAFLMDKTGRWSLAPAFDVTYAYNPAGAWTAQHQMTINGRRAAITRADLRAVAAVAGLKRGRADALLDEVRGAVARWPEFARAVDVPAAMRESIQSTLQLDLG
jgi:serine/threonine-protein kinase HipA